MRVLVIGATGYLGSHLARHLAGAGLSVSGLSRSAERDPIVAAAGATPIRGDLSQLAALLEMIRDHDATIYAAQLLLQEEHDALAAMLQALAGTDRALIFTSGTGVLARRTDGYWDEDSVAEDDPFVPNKYIGFRHVTENLVRSAGLSGSLRAMVVRPPMIWGDGGCGHMVRFYRDAYRLGEVSYVGPGLNLYSNVHVEDLAEVFRLVLERGAPGALYHAVAGELNNRTIAEAVAHDAGVVARPISISDAIARWGKFDALVSMAVCSRSRSPRTRRELGWTPHHLDLLTDIGHANYRAIATSVASAAG
jgi:nucleoside-diphosphate-sugar epimerase